MLLALQAHLLAILCSCFPISHSARSARRVAGLLLRHAVALLAPAGPLLFAIDDSPTKRYGPHGSFWLANPGLPYYPVRAWEIWNEPNLAQYWEPKPDIRAYIGLLRASSRAIKQVDSHAITVMAGMPFMSALAATRFYTQLYRDGVRGAFDALGFHGYSASLGGALARLQAVSA